MMMFLDIE